MKNLQRISAIIALAGLAFGTIGYAQESVKKQSQQTPCDSIPSVNLLNSERIAKKFGGYGIDVLHAGSQLRVSNLYDGKKVTRTLAIVNYPERIDSAFSKEHTEIINGGSIGTVFKKHGWKIEKKNIYFGEIAAGNYKELYKLMGNIAPSRLSIWIYVFMIRKNGKQYSYATISEIYHPDYLFLADLKCMNKDADLYLKETKPIKRDLKKIRQLMTLDFGK